MELWRESRRSKFRETQVSKFQGFKDKKASSKFRVSRQGSFGKEVSKFQGFKVSTPRSAKAKEMFRTRFKGEIVAEFLPPVVKVTRRGAGNRKESREQRYKQRHDRKQVIILCDGMPGIPRKQPLAEFLAGKGYWVFYPRYRGAWESDGEFLKQSPHQDILDVIGELRKGVTEAAFGKKFRVMAEDIFVIGGSFGGAAAILASLDPRVKKVIANCPVVDWGILKESEKAETSKPNYVEYLREAFGNAYRLRKRNWAKLYARKFYNPAHHAGEIDSSKIMMFHAKDDPHVPWSSVARFAKDTGAKLKLLQRGGHLRTEWVVQRYWKEIEEFFARSG